MSAGISSPANSTAATCVCVCAGVQTDTIHTVGLHCAKDIVTVGNHCFSMSK